MATHPLPVGSRVHHAGQIWARSLPGGTATIVEVMGPYRDDAYEYIVTTGKDFSRRPGPNNLETRTTQWASYHTRPAYTQGPDMNDTTYITQQLPNISPCWEDEPIAIKARTYLGKSEWVSVTPEQYKEIRRILTKED